MDVTLESSQVFEKLRRHIGTLADAPSYDDAVAAWKELGERKVLSTCVVSLDQDPALYLQVQR